MKKYQELKDKFLEKGYLQELYWFVVPPPMFELNKTFGTREEQYTTYLRIVEEVYGSDWDYWNNMSFEFCFSVLSFFAPK